MGSRRELEGLLLIDRAGWCLRADDGGHWRLDLLRPPRRLLGRRVRVRGIRSGFDLLDVTAVVTAGQDFSEPWWARLVTAVQRRTRYGSARVGVAQARSPTWANWNRPRSVSSNRTRRPRERALQ
ncbi:DUF5818 domain-containing protein [Mangrovicella endophytica]|uniref:DUF5818 domain-containing protein n=1 Tax=Mangrovicella endophytica TaxID=2066697 RepID=UPI000C9E3882